MGKLNLLIIHCTATPEGREVSAKQIRDWHTKPVSEGGRGWKQVGYADVIHLTGLVENLVPYNEDDFVDAREITNGVSGIVNPQARHVVYVGGCNADMKAKDTRTPMQLLALANYVKHVIAAHPNIQVAGHNQFAPKACPSFDVAQWLKGIGIPLKNIYKHV